MRSLTLVIIAAGFLVAALPAGAETAAPAPLRDGYPAAVEGLIYKDAASGVILYVETDGRHVAAISPEGKLLWRKDPFVDAGLEPYRIARPTISSIGPIRDGNSRAALRFTSSQFGLIDIATGVFTYFGQN